MNCPYCESIMIEGKMVGDGRSSVRWETESEKIGFVDRIFRKKGCVDANYTFSEFSIKGHYCKKCDKIILDVHVN